MDINMIYEINEKLNNVNLFKKQFPCYCNIYARNKNGLKTLYKLVSLSLQKQRYGDKDD
jgi:DNA polymerase III alpha subunit (gram-positive type)